MKIKFLLLISIICLVTKVIISELYDERPIRFHLYQSNAQFKEYVKAKFVIGYDFGQALEILQKSSAACYIATNKSTIYSDLHRDTKFVITCNYNEPFISLHPFMHYSIRLEIDGNLTIINSHGTRIKNYELWW